MTQDALLALIGPYSDETFMRRAIDAGTFSAMNQGNPEISVHEITRADCLAGLEGIVLQTEAQRRICGHENMVPISDAVCIDIFEFPNRACELPFVWAGPTMAHGVCKRLGKRLCRDKEWVRACEGDPAQRYAYGERLDLHACHTHRSAKTHNIDGPCVPKTVQSAYETCSTNTEPSGSFAKCRSPFGVFDLHGNVAEAMTRRDPDGKIYSQLKGSAFFYVDVHRKDDERGVKENYWDHCRHNPRWHVEDMKRAWHVNYHLGFRCCADVATASGPP